MKANPRWVCPGAPLTLFLALTGSIFVVEELVMVLLGILPPLRPVGPNCKRSWTAWSKRWSGRCRLEPPQRSADEAPAGERV